MFLCQLYIMGAPETIFQIIDAGRKVMSPVAPARRPTAPWDRRPRQTGLIMKSTSKGRTGGDPPSDASVTRLHKQP